MPLFENRPKIFRNKDLLEGDYVPDNFEGRQTELEQYQDALYPVYRGEKPKNIFVHGEAGTGKTSVTKHLLNHLETDAAEQGVEITSHYISCSQLKNTYQLVIAITNTLREHRHGHQKENLPKKGHSQPDVIEYMFQELEHTTGTHLLVLDEINNVNDYDLLYELPRAHSNERLSLDTRLPGIIGISNDPGYLDTVPPKVEDTLNDECIRFDPYIAPELIEILNARTRDAFYDDVLEDGVVRYCAARAAQENGSARRALRLLRTAGELARNEHEDTVTEEHVRRAEKKLDRDLVKETINAGTEQTQLALLSVARATSKKDTPERTSNLHNHYTRIVNNMPYFSNSLQHDRFRQRLDTLTEQNILNCKKKNDDGQYSEYALDKDLLVIIDALFDNPILIDPVKDTIKHACRNDLLTEDEIDDEIDDLEF
jgi:cell division control protein 6